MVDYILQLRFSWHFLFFSLQGHQHGKSSGNYVFSVLVRTVFFEKTRLSSGTGAAEWF
jgi:hypothetical protein